VLGARAYDAAGNVADSIAVPVMVNNIGTPPPQTPSDDIVLYASQATTIVGAWHSVPDASAAEGARLSNPDRGRAKISGAAADPADFFEITFSAHAGTAYRLWIRGRAEGNGWMNDSVFAQFTGSTTATGTASYRIGTTSAVSVNLENCSGCGLAGWGWQDDGWGAGGLGPLLYFSDSGTQTIRIQPREDGFSIDQIVLSPRRYLTTAPGGLKNDTVILLESTGSP
jgi:hypothetical protein